MQKLWSYISFVLVGFIAGMTAMYYMAGDQVEVVVRKIKNKKTSGDNSVIIPIDIDSSFRKPKRVKLTKEQKRARRVGKRQKRN